MRFDYWLDLKTGKRLTIEEAAAREGVTVEELRSWAGQMEELARMAAVVQLMRQGSAPAGGLDRLEGAVFDEGEDSHRIDDSTMVALDREAEVSGAD